MNFKEKWESLKNLLELDTKAKKAIALILAFFFAGFVIPGLFLWFLLPVQKFIDTKKKLYTFIVTVFIAIAVIAPNETKKIETGYTRVYSTIKNESTNKTVSYKMFEPIKIVKNDKSDLWNVYDEKNNKIGQIKKTDVVFEGTPEYEQTKQEKAEIDKRAAELAKVLEEKLKKERAAELARLESLIKKAFYRVDLRKFSDDGNGIYYFYINPVIWAGTPFDQKQNIFKNCVTYIQLKTNATDPNMVKYGTKIKSSANAAVLAEYSVMSGIKIK